MKWYWHIPIVNIFFIEEYAQWATDNREDKEFIHSMSIDILIAILAVIVLS